MRQKFAFIVVGLVIVFVFGCAGKSDSGRRGVEGWKPAASLPPSATPITVRILRADNDSIQLIYSIPEAHTVITNSQKGYERLYLANAYQNAAKFGYPILPVVPCKLILPKGKMVADVVVTGIEKVAVVGEHFLEPLQQSFPVTSDDPPPATDPDADVYGSDRPYPERIYEVLGMQRWRGVSYYILNIYPVEYRPQSGELSYYSKVKVTVRLRDEKASEKSVLRFRADPLRSFETTVENPDTLATYWGGEGDGCRVAGFDPSKNFRYVVITSREIINANTTPNIQDLLAHKRSKGLTATAVAVEDIYTEFSGTDNQEKIRNFIIWAYNNWNTDYVLLGGDTNIIPCRKIWCRDAIQSALPGPVPSDLYYACLDGPYNRDGDNRWGEYSDGLNGGDVDLFADVHIGRASAENAEEFSNFVYKTIAYETCSSSDAYLHTALMVGQYMGFSGDSKYAKPAMEEIRKGRYPTKGFLAYPDGCVDTLYEADQTWRKSDLLALINSNKYSIINHMGHGQPDQVMKFRPWDDDKFTNTKYLFANSQACLSGAFDVDCIAEHLTTSTRYGFFAVIMNSREGIVSRDSTNGPSQLFQRYFWNALFAKGITCIGAMLADMRWERRWQVRASNRQVFFEITLFGDPATNLRYTEPANSPPPPAPIADFVASATSGTAPLTVSFTDKSTGDITSWLWDFGDGSTTTQQNPTHTYDDPGTYTVSLTVTGAGGSDTKTTTITVESPPPPQPDPPVADFVASPTSGTTPLTVSFTDKSTGDITSWQWDFDGDGVVDSTQQNPTYTYNEPGTYTVTLTVSGPGGDSTKARTNYIEVSQYIPPQVPVADFTATPTTGNAPLTVQFTDNSANDPTNWLWDFGDGSTSTQQNPAHTYNDPGTYTVTLTVSNAAGSDTAIKVGYIVVEAPPQPSPPTADFSASPTSGTAPLTVSFTDKSTGDVTLWEWDFNGDGVVDSTCLLYTSPSPRD